MRWIVAVPVVLICIWASATQEMFVVTTKMGTGNDALWFIVTLLGIFFFGGMGAAAVIWALNLPRI